MESDSLGLLLSSERLLDTLPYPLSEGLSADVRPDTRPLGGARGGELLGKSGAG